MQLKQNDFSVFDEVTNLNEVASSIASDKTLREAILHLSGKSSVLSDSARKLYESIVNTLTTYDYFLTININKLETTLEYQFYLYNSKVFRDYNSDSTFSMPLKAIAKPTYTTSFLIDIKQEDYAVKIKTEIYRMFPIANEMPTALISQRFERKSKLYLGTGDSTILNADYSYDTETAFRNLEFSWSHTSRSKADENPGIIIEPKKNECKIIAIKSGVYSIGLTVSDGISKSKEDTVLIYVNKRPILLVATSSVTQFSETAFFTNRKYYNGQIAFIASNFQNVDLTKITIQRNISLPDTLHLLKSHYQERYNAKNPAPGDRFPPPPPPPLHDYLKAPGGVVQFAFERMEEGFLINYSYPFQNFEEKYTISIEDNNLVSNPVPFSIANNNVRPMSLNIGTSYYGLKITHRITGDTLKKDYLIQNSFGIQLKLYFAKSGFFIDWGINTGVFFKQIFAREYKPFYFTHAFQHDLIVGKRSKEHTAIGIVMSSLKWHGVYANADKEKFRLLFIQPSFYCEVPVSRKIPAAISVIGGFPALRLDKIEIYKIENNFSMILKLRCFIFQ